MAGSAEKRFLLQWHVTGKCNLRCTHCYQDNYECKMCQEDAVAVFSEFRKFLENKKFKGHINFTGGEPLLCEFLFDLLDLCEQNQITFGVLTNGTLVDSGIAEHLSRYKCLSFVQVSIDGCRGTHDRIRGKGNFDRSFKALQLLKKYGIQTMVSFTLHKGNFADLKKVIRFCRLKQVDRFWADRLVPIGSNKEQILSTAEYAEAVNTLAKENSKGKMVVHTNRAIQFLYGGDCIYHCSAGNSLLAILPDGTLLPCRRLPIKVGNVLQEDLTRLYDTNSVLQELQHFCFPDTCAGCKVANLCKGGAKCLSYTVNGTYNQKDINCCLQ